MIILEGPDGSGKTTLLKRLYGLFPSIEVHPRASDSVNGPVENVHEWAKADLETWKLQPLSFYDRHPILSEPIYGSILRGGCDEWFSTYECQRLGTEMIHNGLIIFCLPPEGHVLENVKVEGQMEGVTLQIESIYDSYKHTMMNLAEFSPSTVVHYDYTKGDPEDEDIISIVEAHFTRWNRKQAGRIA